MDKKKEVLKREIEAFNKLKNKNVSEGFEGTKKFHLHMKKLKIERLYNELMTA